ncbi:MAG: HRDC domain-containing protein [Chloroflexi bacterium]|nr:HRDC domain-containing protein [Chloroflexota bacterium]MDA1220063.1 HRDC domain-containing protein [Chloroflexota bacterium]
MIFSDASLLEMAHYLPQRSESFARINGVGAAKLDEYGESFMSVIRHHSRANGLTERTIPSRLRTRERKPASKLASPTIQETKRLLSENLSISQISRRRGMSERTIIGHLEKLAQKGEDLHLDHLRQGNRILSSEDMEQVVLTPACLETLGLDSDFTGLFLAQ